MQYFHQPAPVDEPDIWQCQCKKQMKQKKGSGWTNLLNHIKTQHPDYDKDDGKQQRIDNYVIM